MAETTTTDLTPMTEREPSVDSPSSPPAQPANLWWVWVLVLAVVVLASYLFYRQYESSQQQQQTKGKGGAGLKAVPVTVTAARQGDIGVFVETLGTVTPLYTVSVTSRVQGQIMKVYYRESQFVRKGDPLLDIDPRPYEAALTQVEGQLARDQASLSEAENDLNRYQAALARNAIAQQQVYDQEQVVQQDKGTVKNDEGNVENARVNLAYCHITSPIEGRVGLRLVDPGNIVQANGTTPLVVVTQLQPITVIFSVAEDFLPQIQQQLHAGKKMPVDALDRSESKVLANGSLTSIDNQIDTTTGTVKLRATFPNRDSMLFPNQFVNAKLLLDTQHNVTLIPTQSIQRNAQGPFVYVIKPASEVASSDGSGASGNGGHKGKSGGDGTKSGHKGQADQSPSDQKGSGGQAKSGLVAVMRMITVGVSDSNDTGVQGIATGEEVAISGFDKLQDGMQVSVRQQGASGQTNASSDGSGNGAGSAATGAPAQ